MCQDIDAEFIFFTAFSVIVTRPSMLTEVVTITWLCLTLFVEVSADRCETARGERLKAGAACTLTLFTTICRYFGAATTAAATAAGAAPGGHPSRR